MRKLMAFGVGALGLCAVAHALPSETVIIENLPASAREQGGFPVQNATFSDGLSSGGNYFYSQSLAQQFTINVGATAGITGINFWGASEYLGTSQPWLQTALATNIIGFDISILRVTPDGNFPTVQSWSLTRNQVTQALTGNYTAQGTSPVFQIGAALTGDLSLTAGVYAISVGARLSNPDGSAFAWVDGQWDGSDPATRLYATIGDVPALWGNFTPAQTTTSGAFQLTGTITPAPGALALLGIAGLGSRRRRRL